MDRIPIVFPVRFATRQKAVQTTTRELSIDGVYVRCLEPPPARTSLDLKLYLPGLPAAVETAGTIEQVGANGERGFWARFDGLEGDGRMQIREVLDRRRRAAEAVPIGAVTVKPASASDDPRRAFQRYNARFAVRFATVQDFVLEYAANISAGGVFVHTEDAPPLKSVVKIEMELPGVGDPVPARGVVVHRVTPENAKSRGTMAGMGVQFLDADDKFRDRINAAIDHILKKG